MKKVELWNLERMIKKLLRNFGTAHQWNSRKFLTYRPTRVSCKKNKAFMIWPSAGIKSAHVVRRSTFPRYQTFPRLWNGREFARYIGFEEKNILFLKIPKHTSISWMLDQAGLGRDKYVEWILVFRYQHGCFLTSFIAQIIASPTFELFFYNRH